MADEEKTLIEILEEFTPIDVAKYMNFVHSSKSGAIATFSGTTRDTFEGKTVVELRYEAYVPMVIRSVKSICLSARSSWSLDSIAVAHRLGPVPVGETSIFIAISAVHRVDALDACKYLIDEIKALVPIWKKEVYSNGEVWKENSEFLERRSEIGTLPDLGSGCCRVKVKVEEQNTKNCCGSKVKVGANGAPEHVGTNNGDIEENG
ncbi:molybdopterin synthase catalytic subunit-like [Telopea speciosissima]|uniref:molybdopterin synthase catalytic subunit-like n=1 Tax=Telopea speciosissima TaxID=54955 RepID=UPI001CC614D5|nr:molybdopterin synthase catalytic subunit-like [Telopea speciosissima]